MSSGVKYKKVLTSKTVGRNVLDCEYAVRGAIPILAEKITHELAAGSNKYKFDSITSCNIGNPLILIKGCILIITLNAYHSLYYFQSHILLML